VRGVERAGGRKVGGWGGTLTAAASVAVGVGSVRERERGVGGVVGVGETRVQILFQRHKLSMSSDGGLRR